MKHIQTRVVNSFLTRFSIWSLLIWYKTIAIFMGTYCIFKRVLSKSLLWLIQVWYLWITGFIIYLSFNSKFSLWGVYRQEFVILFRFNNIFIFNWHRDSWKIFFHFFVLYRHSIDIWLQFLSQIVNNWTNLFQIISP